MNDWEALADEINDQYDGKYSQINAEILAALEEGFNEGLESGVREGILYGLNECIDLGFLNLNKAKTKSIEEIFQGAASETIKTLASSRTRAEVCPALNEYLEKQCDRVINMLADPSDLKRTGTIIDLLARLKLEDLANKNIKYLSTASKKALPSNFIFQALFNGCQSTIWDCTKSGVKKCRNRIEKSAKELDL